MSPGHESVLESLADQLGWVLDEIDQGHLQADHDAKLRLRAVLAELDRAHESAGATPRTPGAGLNPRA